MVHHVFARIDVNKLPGGQSTTNSTNHSLSSDLNTAGGSGDDGDAVVSRVIAATTAEAGGEAEVDLGMIVEKANGTTGVERDNCTSDTVGDDEDYDHQETSDFILETQFSDDESTRMSGDVSVAVSTIDPRGEPGALERFDCEIGESTKTHVEITGTEWVAEQQAVKQTTSNEADDDKGDLKMQ
jgi:hypothetical protein